MFPEREELTLGMLVVDEQVNVGQGGVSHSLEGIDCGANGSGDFVGAKVKTAVDCEAISEDEKGRCFVDWVRDGVYHDIGGIKGLCGH